MRRTYVTAVAVFVAFGLQGCAALQFLDGSSPKELDRFRTPRDRLWFEIEYLNKTNKDAQTQIASLKGENERISKEKENEVSSRAQLKATYDSLDSELRTQLKNKDITIKGLEEKLSVTFVDRVLFESGKARITPEGKGILAKVGNTLKNVRDMQIRVVGHTDNVPIKKAYLNKFPSNWELSSARATAVVHYLQKETGVDAQKLEAVGKSFYSPLASHETKGGRTQNRRVEIIISPRLEK